MNAEQFLATNPEIQAVRNDIALGRKTFPTPAANESSQRAGAFFKAVQETLGYLYSRWQDEQEYENIADYQLPLKKIDQEHGVVITKMNKRPFGLVFQADGRTYQVSVTRRSMAYKRIA